MCGLGMSSRRDFLVNISNDGWFNGSCEHEEHLAICRFRAVECRRSIARAVNMGISTVIDGNGRVRWPHRSYRVWPDGRVEDPPGVWFYDVVSPDTNLRWMRSILVEASSPAPHYFYG